MNKTIKTISMLALVLGSTKTIAQNAAINSSGSAPDASAMLDVSSTTKGLLTPRMTAVQRAAIASPATGLIVYQTDGTDGYYYYDGGSWVLLMNTDASNLASGTVPTARLGSGAADNTTYLRGDGTWTTPSIADGSVSGTKFAIRTVSANTTLTSSDFIVIVNGNYTTTLPATPSDGQVIFISVIGTAGSLNSNGKGFQIQAAGDWIAGTYTWASDFGSSSNCFVYSATADKWLLLSNL